MENIKNNLYNEIIGSYSKDLYKNFFEKIPNNSYILDIGIGNGYAICENSNLIIEKNIKIIGIDVDFNSILTCKENINKYNLNSNIYSVLCELDNLDVFIPTIKKFINKNNDKNNQNIFDYIYFSNSYSVIPNILELLNKSKKYLANEDAEIVICTTIEKNNNNIKNFLKKNAKYILLGIDFGRLITLDAFKNEIKKIKLYIYKQENTIKRNIFVWGDVNIETFYCKIDNNFTIE